MNNDFTVMLLSALGESSKGNGLPDGKVRLTSMKRGGVLGSDRSFVPS